MPGSPGLCRTLGIEVPLICGAMYPCSNPELVAAVSEAGGIGIVQPLSLSYVHGHEFRAGLQYIRRLTSKPIGVNLIIEQSSKQYLQRVHQWLDIALEEQVPFLVTALGNPRWVVDRARSAGVTVYHRAGGHAGSLSSRQLLDDIGPLGKPLVCAGGIGTPAGFAEAMAMGYDGAQLGTRFIATTECHAHADYKQAIIEAAAKDIVLSEKISGVPVAVINTPYIKSMGTRAGPLARWMLRGRRTRHWMRTLYSLQSIWKLKRASLQGMHYRDIFQAGKSVEGITAIKPVAEVVAEFAAALPQGKSSDQ